MVVNELKVRLSKKKKGRLGCVFLSLVYFFRINRVISKVLLNYWVPVMPKVGRKPEVRRKTKQDTQKKKGKAGGVEGEN
jgi:hypothetical protein